MAGQAHAGLHSHTAVYALILVSWALDSEAAPLERRSVGRLTGKGAMPALIPRQATSSPSSAIASATSTASITSDSLGGSTYTQWWAWVGVLGGAVALLLLITWRCMYLRRSQRSAAPGLRALIAPKGINFLGIRVAPPAPESPPDYPARARRGRGRASRRAAHGPDVGEGGRRLDSGDVDDGVSISDQLPAYMGREGRPPTYERQWSELQGPEPDTEDSAAYELRTRSGARAGPSTTSPTLPSPVLLKDSFRPGLPMHRDSMMSSLSADTLRDEAKAADGKEESGTSQQ